MINPTHGGQTEYIAAKNNPVETKPSLAKIKPSVSNTTVVVAGAVFCAMLAGSPAQAGGNTMTFQDNFNAFNWSADGSHGWMTTYPWSGLRTLSGNNEAECYTDPTVGTNPFSLAAGVLSLSAAPADPAHNPCHLPYTSGLITTFKSFSQLYGIFEIRARMPRGQGLWPAFWLLPSSGAYSSELDVFEVLENATTTLYSTTHGIINGAWGADSQKLNVADTTTQFHVYSVDWEPKTITFRIDGKVTATAPTPSSMNTPMFMLINLAVGGWGSWPGTPDGSTPFPASLQVDWARAYATANTLIVTGNNAIVHIGAAGLPAH